MNLFGYEKSPLKIGLLIQFTNLKSNPCKEGTSLRTQTYFRLSFLSAEEKRQPEVRLRSQAKREQQQQQQQQQQNCQINAFSGENKLRLEQKY